MCNQLYVHSSSIMSIIMVNKLCFVLNTLDRTTFLKEKRTCQVKNVHVEFKHTLYTKTLVATLSRALKSWC